VRIYKTIKWDRFGYKSGGGTIQILSDSTAYYIGDKPPSEFFERYPSLEPHPTLDEYYIKNNDLLDAIVDSALL
jgi:hypothetical protein